MLPDELPPNKERKWTAAPPLRLALGASREKMSTEDIQKFYRSTFDDLSIQEKLIATNGRVEFIDVAVEIGSNQGFNFSIAEMQQTMDEFGEARSVHESMEDPWVRKIMGIGWVPIGYTR